MFRWRSRRKRIEVGERIEVGGGIEPLRDWPPDLPQPQISNVMPQGFTSVTTGPFWGISGTAGTIGPTGTAGLAGNPWGHVDGMKWYECNVDAVTTLEEMKAVYKFSLYHGNNKHLFITDEILQLEESGVLEEIVTEKI